MNKSKKQQMNKRKKFGGVERLANNTNMENALNFAAL